MTLDEKIEEILNHYEMTGAYISGAKRVEYKHYDELAKSKIVIDFAELIQKEREEATKHFAIWFEANTGGLFRGEMEQKWNEYLKEKGISK